MPPQTGTQPEISAAALAAATRLVERALSAAPPSGPPVDLASAGERLMSGLSQGLARSFGAFGARSLLARSLARAQQDHPVLASVTVLSAGDGVTHPEGRPASEGGLTQGVQAFGSIAAEAGLSGWVAHLTDLLGALIGDRLTAIVLEQSASLGLDTGAPPASAPEVDRHDAGPRSPLSTVKDAPTPVVDS